ncbi:MAG: ABC transporter, ATP-binding protein [Parcubacteria group bacterium GW2011_GWA2_33_14]|uniref:Multidrug ABC transporter ATP-binding protein n=1 Tax=Candidatus Staskawiczbacteria bacterium RIFCSPHIGHO2_02_FULL_33_16 TaxID=1802204 RepID=A0A1G2HSU7_9BACT|nr:MAG: ABC transporter, ATP-binding protein [Parcubacteria group bacterium GW2011_GWA2_33_14]OGZ65614.1 MAG: multidrug ABC transporter ATP-binding protein [Candidatus Staskawiczbacteria bacterium RIFCSPHIGHO2_02_FULL_33_16]OGZ71121.1 MAG: multidrug ABC transporter ATP-binding protein [Candidatus Staskawiczbacteria bacterium RIFCSPLOWO2_01_FULL_33_13]
MIEIKNITKKFKDFIAVDNISLKVNKGEIFAFLGPNGAGKSTTIKMLTTLLTPTAGEIFLNDHNVTENPHQTRRSFGIVFQDPSLDNELTAYENMQFHAILYGLKKEVYKKRIVDLLNLVELYDRKDSFVKTFSGGMKRRLEIARGLLHHPKVLFLDEPTIGLDPQTRNHIWAYIHNLNKQEGVTIFFTTHHMEEVERIAQRIAIIDHGKIIITGTIEEILNKAQTKNLEDAFIALTGNKIREEAANVGLNQMRINSKLMR